MKKITSLAIVVLLSSATTLMGYKYLNANHGNSDGVLSFDAPSTRVERSNASGFDFTSAAESSLHTVVHVKNVSYRRTPSNPILEYFYGYRGGEMQAQVGTGSGVIISKDGYIVTNNHVIQGASEIEITLNNDKVFPAKLIGTDERRDIALLKIETNDDLPYATFADSDNVKVGEWVLAVGNPYNLNSTVTAGIISAKARNLDSTGIQSFLQTDAAVNPGNSGGALVNTNGELIGINTMISSNTGSYVGYSFAVPSNTVKKIVNDLKNYGKVQQGMLGIQGIELNASIAQSLQLSQTRGFIVEDILPNSGAFRSELKIKDIIVGIDNAEIKGFSDITRILSNKSPKETVNLTVIRNNKRLQFPVVLSN